MLNTLARLWVKRRPLNTERGQFNPVLAGEKEKNALYLTLVGRPITPKKEVDK